MKHIYYREGYKYQLAKEYAIKIDIKPISDIFTDYINLSIYGWLVIKAGYAWDGPSGPAIDTKNFMRGSLVHDALYALMREGKLDRCHKDDADRILEQLCKEDGMWGIRAWWVYVGVSKFGAKATTEEGENPTVRAP